MPPGPPGQEAGQPEQPDLLGGRRIQRKITEVVGPALLARVRLVLLHDLVLVARHPEVGADRGHDQQQRSPPGEPGQQNGCTRSADHGLQRVAELLDDRGQRRQVGPLVLAGPPDLLRRPRVLEMRQPRRPDRRREQLLPHPLRHPRTERRGDGVPDRRDQLAACERQPGQPDRGRELAGGHRAEAGSEGRLRPAHRQAAGRDRERTEQSLGDDQQNEPGEPQPVGARDVTDQQAQGNRKGGGDGGHRDSPRAGTSGRSCSRRSRRRGRSSAQRPGGRPKTSALSTVGLTVRSAHPICSVSRSSPAVTGQRRFRGLSSTARDIRDNGGAGPQAARRPRRDRR